MEVVFKFEGYLKACNLETILAHPVRSVCTGVQIAGDVGRQEPAEDPK